MIPTCADLDRFASPAADVGVEERALWHRHLEGCLDCQQQWAADQMLRTGLAAKPSLDFSLGFDGSLRRRLSEPRPRPLGPLARSVLAGYGTAAAGLSIWILGEIDWPGSLSFGEAGILLVLLGLATPLLLLPGGSPLSPSGLD